MSGDFTMQDQIDALKYVAENNGVRFVSLEIHQSLKIHQGERLDDFHTELLNPVYTFVYHGIGNENIVTRRVEAEIDEAINQEILRFQNVG